MKEAREKLTRHVVDGFAAKDAERAGRRRRIGLELKFPAVDSEGRAAPAGFAPALFEAAAQRLGWRPVLDGGRLIGALRPGPQNETLLGCETAHCKIEISMAHQPDLHALSADLRDTLCELQPPCRSLGATLLGLGAQPLSTASPVLMQKKSRNLFWNRIFGKSAEDERNTGVHLFTTTATNQVHLDVSAAEAAQALNVLNASAGIQIAIMANSSLREGRPIRAELCSAEMAWDRWLPPAEGRTGVPLRPLRNLQDWAGLLMDLRPVYVRRDEGPIGLPGYDAFAEFFQAGTKARGEAPGGYAVALTPQIDDFDLHTTFNWFCARISQYHTLEVRCSDQQPPDALLAPAAFTLGLLENLGAASVLLDDRPWASWRALRVDAARYGLNAEPEMKARCKLWVEVSEEGLRKRGLGEEVFLAPLHLRLQTGLTPAEEAVKLLEKKGMQELLKARDAFSHLEAVSIPTAKADAPCGPSRTRKGNEPYPEGIW